MSVADSPQQDRFVHDRLPPRAHWPDIIALPSVPQSGLLNCVWYLLDRHLDGPAASRIAIGSGARTWSYGELGASVGRIANVLIEDYGVEPGNRVFIRGANSPEVAAIWLAVQKIGAVAVTTMQLLRAGELATLLDISRPRLAVCELKIASELEAALGQTKAPCALLTYGDETGGLYAAMEGKRETCNTCATLASDISIIGFTSGTTGNPKATVHFHRDILAICETMSRHIIRTTPEDRFIGTAPLAFTFGLGGLLVFPFYAGACTILNGSYSPDELARAIADYKASVCFTVPTFYRQMLRLDGIGRLMSLRLAVSSGEALPPPVREQWEHKTGVELAEVLGSTEMLHAFAGAIGAAVKSGFIGPALPGFELAILDDLGNPLPSGKIGWLAVKGPTGCRYLDDPRQTQYVQNGWNITGDACAMDKDGYVAYYARYDDMIVSAGYNISGLEVENALLSHPRVFECAVIGEPDTDRGQIVTAYVVPSGPMDDSEDMINELQAHVRRSIAPYKYPRRIEFLANLPRNESGKLQRFRLRS